MSLDADQIETFRRDGALILPGFFTPAEVGAWRQEVLDYFDAPVTGDDWRRALRARRADDFHIGEDPTVTAHARLASVYRALHARADWTGENELLVRPGSEGAPWLGARAPHLDYPTAVPVKTLANTVFYLNDVESRGAAMMYWPGSHHIAWDHHRANPRDYMAKGERGQDATFQIITARMPNEPIEFTARAGDLLIWHAFLLHSASINMRPETRLAIFGRWGVARTGDAPWNFDGDIWADWDFSPAPSPAGPHHVERRLDPAL